MYALNSQHNAADTISVHEGNRVEHCDRMPLALNPQRLAEIRERVGEMCWMRTRPGMHGEVRPQG